MSHGGTSHESQLTRSSPLPASGPPLHESGPKDERIGTVICGWTLERALGAGRVCESWLATKAGAPDAVVRVLRDPFASDPLARAEWLGASWASNRFTHARVPRLLQDGADDRGAPVVVRRWANGEPLDQMIRGGTIDPTARAAAGRAAPRRARDGARAWDRPRRADAGERGRDRARDRAPARLRDPAGPDRDAHAAARALVTVHGAPAARGLDGHRSGAPGPHRAVRRVVGGGVPALRDRRRGPGRRVPLARACPAGRGRRRRGGGRPRDRDRSLRALRERLRDARGHPARHGRAQPEAQGRRYAGAVAEHRRHAARVDVRARGARRSADAPDRDPAARAARAARDRQAQRVARQPAALRGDRRSWWGSRRSCSCARSSPTAPRPSRPSQATRDRNDRTSRATSSRSPSHPSTCALFS